MYQENNKKPQRKVGKPLTLIVSLLLILSVVLGGTIALLLDESGPVKNLFNPSQVTTDIDEEFDGETKKNVCIKNTGDTDAWIRAAVVVTWQDKEGNVYGQAPVADTDYTAWEPGVDWLKGNDGFYYYTKPVPADTSTANPLIEQIAPRGNPPADGYYLTVEIIGSGIQNKPANVFNDQWGSSGLEVDDRNTDPMKWTLIKSEGE